VRDRRRLKKSFGERGVMAIQSTEPRADAKRVISHETARPLGAAEISSSEIFNTVAERIRESFQAGDHLSCIDSVPLASISVMLSDASKQLAFIDAAKSRGERTDEVKSMVMRSLAELVSDSNSHAASSSLSVALEEAKIKIPAGLKILAEACSEALALGSKDCASIQMLSERVSAVLAEASPLTVASGKASAVASPSSTNSPSSTSSSTPSTPGSTNRGASHGGAGHTVGGGGRFGGRGVGMVGPQPSPDPDKSPVNALMRHEVEANSKQDLDQEAAGKKRFYGAIVAGSGALSGGAIFGALRALGGFTKWPSAEDAYFSKATIPSLSWGIATYLGGKIASKVFSYCELRMIREYVDKTEGPLEEALQGVKKPEGFLVQLKKSAEFAFARTGMEHAAVRAIGLLEATVNLDSEVQIVNDLRRATVPAERAKLEAKYRATYDGFEAAVRSERYTMPDGSKRSITSLLFGGDVDPSTGKRDPQGLHERHEANLGFLLSKLDSYGTSIGADFAPMVEMLRSQEIAGFHFDTPGRTVEWLRIALGRNPFAPEPKGYKTPVGVPAAIHQAAKEFEKVLGTVLSQSLTKDEADKFGITPSKKDPLTVKQVWTQLETIGENISTLSTEYSKGLGLRHRYVVEQLLSNVGEIVNLDPEVTGKIRVEGLSNNPDPAKAKEENERVQRESTEIKQILLYTDIEHPAVPGKKFSSVGNATNWISFVEDNPTMEFDVPQTDAVSGIAQRDASGNILLRKMSGAEISAKYHHYLDNILTPEGQRVWGGFYEKLDRPYRQVYLEQKASNELIDPLIEGVRNGSVEPRYTSKLQKLYDRIVKRCSGNSLSVTIEPGMGDIEINNMRVTLVSYLESIRKTLRHYDIFNLENEMTRETVIGNLSRETQELLSKMKPRQQEYQGKVISRGSFAECLWNRYNPLYRAVGSLLRHTFENPTGGIAGWATGLGIMSVGFGTAAFGWGFAPVLVGGIFVNWAYSGGWPIVKSWLGTEKKK
jgi:hypothetical protein